MCATSKSAVLLKAAQKQSQGELYLGIQQSVGMEKVTVIKPACFGPNGVESLAQVRGVFSP